MTHSDKIARWIGPGRIGVEIGAFKSPVPGLVPPPFYVDCFKEFALENVHADYYGDASHLPFQDNSLDYVVTSHVLEHVANPVAALAEWYRVLRPGGIVYLVVPDRRFTWDHPRPLTPVSHLLDDFTRGTTACDATHIDEFVFEADWSMYSPGTPAAEIPERRALLARGMHHAVGDGRDINIHFHTFEPGNVLALLAALRDWPATRFHWEIVDHAERFPAENPIGFLAVIRVHKRWRDRLAAWRLRGRIARDRRQALRADAQPFAEWTKRQGSDPPSRIAACIDAPQENSAVAAEGFVIRGWVSLANPAELAAIEARVGDQLIGTTDTLHIRPDVIAALALPAGTPTGFDIPASYPSAGEAFQVRVSARLKDQSLLPILDRTLARS